MALGILDVIDQLDGKPPSKRVSIGDGKFVDVFGISARGIAYLLQRFPPLLKALSGEGVNISALQEIAPDAIAAVCAAGCGASGAFHIPDNMPTEEVAAMLAKAKAQQEKVEAFMDALGITVQADIVEAVAERTFPKGFGPFVERVQALSAGVELEVIKAKAMTSSKPQKNSEPLPTQESGTSPPVN